jgi:hypothetical protein
MIVISNSVDNSSSGLVLKYFLQNISKRSFQNQIYVAIEASTDYLLSKNERFFQIGKNNYLGIWQKIILILFGISIIDSLNAKQIFKKLKEVNNSSNKVVVFVTGINFFTLYLTQFLYDYNSKDIIYLHFLDPLVGFQGWGENKYLRRSKLKLINKKLSKLKSNRVFLSTTNRTFSLFLKNTYNLNCLPNSYVSYNVIRRPQIDFKFSGKLNIYYRGTFNSMRGGRILLNILDEISTRNPNYNFIFQGDVYLEGANKDDFKNLKFFDFSLDDFWLKNANILLDIDLCNQDVFISGKFYEYLQYPKPILVISPPNSAINNFILDFYSENIEIKSANFELDSICERLFEFEKLNLQNSSLESKESPKCIIEFIEN